MLDLGSDGLVTYYGEKLITHQIQKYSNYNEL